MTNIKITVRNKKAINATPDVPIVCGNSGYTVTFDFDSEWEGYYGKVARFVYYQEGRAWHQEQAFSGNTVTVPVLSNTTYVLIGVYAGDLSSTSPARVVCTRSILCGESQEQVTPDMYQALQSQIGDLADLNLEESTSLVQAMNWLLEYGSAGKNGESATHEWDGTVLTIKSASGTSSADLRGPAGPQGEKGETGSAGKNGVSATHSWDGTVLTIKSASGTSSADLRGPQGERGPQGPKGEPGGGGGGASSLEDMLAKEILPETSPVFNENEGMFLITETVSIDTNCGYIVNLNGVEYETEMLSVENGIILMNKGADIASFDGLVFAVLCDSEVCALITADGATSATISIKEIQKIPSVYLPTTGSSFVEFVKDGDEWFAFKTCEQLVAEIQQGLTPVAVVKEFGYQKETIYVPFTAYDPTVNSVLFSTVTVCTPYSDKNDGGFFALFFQIAADGTAHAYAKNLNFTPESI